MRSAMILACLALAGCTGTEISGVLAPEPTPDATPDVDAGVDEQIEEPNDAGRVEQMQRDASVPVQEDAAVEMPADDWPAEWAAREDAMLVLVNELRAQGTRCGARNFGPVPPLAMNSALRLAARLHSKDMADQDYFDHNSQDGRDPWDRMREAGYDAFGVGENIAAGNSSAAAAFDQWVNSPGHCSNMMSRDATEIGVGYASNPSSSYTHYWTQTFGQR